MRVNCYSEEITDRIEIVEKSTNAGDFVGLRFYIETPVTKKNIHGMRQVTRGPNVLVDGDDDSSAVTFWVQKKDIAKLEDLFDVAVDMLAAKKHAISQLD